MSRRPISSYNHNFLPTAAVQMLRQRLYQSLGLACVVLAVVIAAMLVSYNPADASFNTASTGSITNYLDYPGAVLADLLFQYFGLASYMFSIALATIGAYLVINYRITHFGRRVLVFAIGLSALSIFLSLFKRMDAYHEAPLIGGAVGNLLLSNLSGLFKVPLKFLYGFLGFVIAIAAFNYALNLNLTKICQKMIGLLVLARNKRQHRSVATLANSEIISSPSSSPSPRLVRTMTPRISSDEVEDAEAMNDYFAAPETTPLTNPVKTVLNQTPKQAPLQRFVSETGNDYQLPTAELLDKLPIKQGKSISDEALQHYARQLESVLQEFGVRGEIVAVCPGPVVTLYELKPAAGIKTSRVIGLADDIARSMSALSARIAVVPGRNVIGIELPNPTRETVYLRDLLLADEYRKHSAHLAMILGKDIGGNPIIADLSRMPHLLVAGTTGSGKSVSINTMILSILFRLSPDQCKFIMIDPKMLELSIYDGIPHLLTPVVTDPKKAVVALKWAVREMENRYRAMSKLGVRNIDGFNARIQEARSSGELLMRRVQTGFDPDTGKPIFENQPLDLNQLPYIVVVVDEMADLMLVAGKEIEAAVQRLAQMARAAGIHLIMATQRPSVDVITGTIKANFPTRISFMVTSKIDSRTILGEQGAEQLLGQGDMLYMVGGGRLMRVHGPFIKDPEVERIVQFLKDQGEPNYIDSVTEDDEESGFGGEDDANSNGDAMYQQAVEIIRREGKASTSFIQRHLQIGYNRAARIIEQMEKEGLVSPANHVGKREILM